ncbi:MAG: EamA family transporter [Bernardetiaceae bacterium]|nr:EamA family transporter [Bernardetiaceae bacterium]
MRLFKNIKHYTELHFIVFLNGLVPTIALQINLSALEIVFLRTLMAIALLAMVLSATGVSFRVSFRMFIGLLLTGFTISFYWVLLIFSAQISNASVSLIGIASSPLWVSLIQYITRQKQLSFGELLTSAAAIFGIYIILSGDMYYGWGFYVALAGGFFAACVTVLNAFFAPKHAPMLSAFYQMIGACLGTVIGITLIWNYTPDLLSFDATWGDIGLILVLAALISVYAYSALIKLLRTISPFTVALVNNLSPIYGMLAALIVSRESEIMNGYFYAGSLILIVSVVARPLVNNYFTDLIDKNKDKNKAEEQPKEDAEKKQE